MFCDSVFYDHDSFNKMIFCCSFRKDIDEMEHEKELVNKRIERMQRRVEGMPNIEEMLEVSVYYANSYKF